MKYGYNNRFAFYILQFAIFCSNFAIEKIYVSFMKLPETQSITWLNINMTTKNHICKLLFSQCMVTYTHFTYIIHTLH